MHLAMQGNDTPGIFNAFCEGSGAEERWSRIVLPICRKRRATRVATGRTDETLTDLQLGKMHAFFYIWSYKGAKMDL